MKKLVFARMVMGNQMTVRLIANRLTPRLSCAFLDEYDSSRGFAVVGRSRSGAGCR